MKNDAQIQKDVMEQLRWEPILNAAEIGVAVKNGIVTLSGQVDSYAKKLAAERAVKYVKHVRALAEDIQIGVSPMYKKTDAEIAEAVLNALKWHTAIEEEKLKIKVEDGVVRLEGEVEWEFQRSSAKMAIENLRGVRSVINLITLKPKIKPADIHQKISNAFHRKATLDAQNITIEVAGNTAILRGSVRSLAEKEDAEDAAWSAPGIAYVDNRLTINVPEMALID